MIIGTFYKNGIYLIPHRLFTLENDEILDEYLSKKDLFDPYKDIGYTKNNFTNEWPKAKEKMKGLIKFLEDKAEEK